MSFYQAIIVTFEDEYIPPSDLILGKILISSQWRTISQIKILLNNNWETVSEVKINYSNSWKTLII